MVSEQCDFQNVIKHLDIFGFFNDDPNFKTNEEREEEEFDEMKLEGYLFGRNEKNQAQKLDPVLPTAMRHHVLVQDPESKMINQNHPITKAVHKLRISNAFMGGALTKQIGKMDHEDTTARSFSSNSKINEIKHSYRKNYQHTEDTMPLELLSSIGSGHQIGLDSKKSLISTQSRGFSSERNQWTHHKSEPIIKEQKSQDKPKPTRPKANFPSDYKPSILSTTECNL